ncbi:AimR family lysis-lysogeny pheromone receptor [Halobacillus litoralis]|uniref:Uncharacterized protein n=1 Tax=Halobacillus litoralis TaxID=45668 RepID=A0A410MCP8_9BACI|nr:AimR family lysis-lysogeny pheromone receptor [Halobacillus litoralis]QAS52480.1 hypothetical protein HLI_09745 [Halobacillus litoralis]
MREHQLIEPSLLIKLQMKHSSSLYYVYISNLKRYSRIEAIQHTKQYALDHFPTEKNEQLAHLEFLYMNDYFEEIATLLNTAVSDENTGVVYQFLLHRLKKKATRERLDDLLSLQFTQPSLHCLHLFALVYSYYDLKIYTVLDKYLDKCDKALQLVDEPLMYYYLNQRYQELLFQHYWKTDNSILASRYAYKMINTEVSPRKKSRMYHNLALNNLFNGYESSIEPLHKALKIAETHHLDTAAKSIKQHSIPFISAFHLRTGGIYTPDPVETAHIALAEGDYKTTCNILRSMSSLTPFQETYLGFAEKDVHLLNHSYKRFIHEQGDHFFARLPLEYLARLNYGRGV